MSRAWMLVVAMTTISSFAVAVEEATPVAANPFFTTWETPFGLPPFDRIEEAHFLPALERGIDERRREVQAIAANPEPPTFANTIEALDAAGGLLTKVGGVFYNLTAAETSDGLQAVAERVAPLVTALDDDMLLDAALFARVTAVWDGRGALELTPQQARLLEKTYTSFTRGGAKLDGAAKLRLRAVNERLAVLGLQFAENLRSATNDYRLVVTDPADLAGLSAGAVAAAADAATAAGLEGKWVFTLQWPSLWPFLQGAENRDLRREILTAYTGRCAAGTATDNTAILAEEAALRAEKARLLGYPSWADYVLDDQMAKTPAAVRSLLDRLWTPSLAAAGRDAATLGALMKADGIDQALAPWDWRYYAERLRRERYAIDEDALRAYFPLDRVLAGAFAVAGRLYGIRFVERHDLPTYHPEVRSFEVLDEKGAHLGIFLADYHPRPGKRGGAWSSEIREQHREGGRDIRPIVVNVGNFSRPSGETPALLSLDEVSTLFHELGHGLHSLLADIDYRTLGTTPRDFVELPSQIMENWLWEPEVLALYARHWQTGEAIPGELVAKVVALRRFDEAFASVEYLAACYLDLAWHTQTTSERRDVAAFEQAAMSEIGLIPEIVVRYKSPYFAHIFGGLGGYSAGYYSYIWSEVLDADAFAAFKERGLFDRATAESFRRNILAPVGSEDPMALFKRFRGREPSVDALLVRRGLAPAVQPAPAAD